MQRVIFCLLFLLPLTPAVRAQVIQRAAVRLDTVSRFGALYATIAGTEYKVADSAVRFWLVRGGKAIVFTAPGSQEESNDVGEGIYYAEAAKIVAANRMLTEATDEAATKTVQETLRQRNLLPLGIYASSFHASAVQEATTRQGRYLLLLSLTDKADVPRVVVLSPDDLRTAYWERARLAGIRSQKITINYYPRKGNARMGPNDKPEFIRVFDLDALLQEAGKR